MRYTAGLYMRLSREDGDGEGGSIKSQRLMLRAFAGDEKIDVIDEYVDDGYSGTSYDRPEFKRMIEDIESKKINTVIVKDMSRLGRDYISTGELTDVYFPEHFVRFIAINDGYDSMKGSDDMAPFRHVINEMYARDISKKIRSSLYAKMRDGQYIGSFAPYGYTKSRSDKNKLVVDPVSSAVVKLIFEMRASGKTVKNIVEKLNDNKILVPLDYRNMSKKREIKGTKWTESGVCKILRNQVYIGHTVQGKSIKPSMRSKRSFPKNKKDWIVVKNTHEGIVPEELFLRCQSQREKI